MTAALSQLDMAKLAEHHIPVADNRAFYIVAIEDGTALGALLTSEMPTEDELKLLRHFQVFQLTAPRSIYNEGWNQKQLAMEYPGNSGHNTQVFVKCDDGWRYRKFTWTSGPSYWPSKYGDDARSMTLMELLDFIERDLDWPNGFDGEAEYVEGRHWAAYKAEHGLTS